jgi:adenosylcobinamide amidohydrolase
VVFFIFVFEIVVVIFATKTELNKSFAFEFAVFPFFDAEVDDKHDEEESKEEVGIINVVVVIAPLKL